MRSWQLILAAIALSCATILCASAQDSRAAGLSDFKAKWVPAPFDGWVQLAFVGTITNRSAGRLKGALCVALYDKDGFEIDKSEADPVNLGLSQSAASPGYVRMKAGLGPQVVSLKAYVGEFGCVTAPTEAISATIGAVLSGRPNS